MKQAHARSLLKADVWPGGPGWSESKIAEAMEVGTATVEPSSPIPVINTETERAPCGRACDSDSKSVDGRTNCTADVQLPG